MSNRKRTVIIIAIILASIAVSFIANFIISMHQSNAYPIKYSKIVEKYASEFNVPEYIIYAIIKTESNFDPDLKSESGALGLMQMIPKTFKFISSGKHLDEDTAFEELEDPDTAIRYGVYYLRYLFNRFHKWNTVFAAYNAGEGTVSKWLNDPKYSNEKGELTKIPDSNVKSYVNKVNKAINYYKDTYYRNEVSVK